MRMWLKKMREKFGLTQNEIASQVGVTQSYYSLIEKGERQEDMPISMVQKLSEIFGISIEEILKMENEK